MPTSANNSPAAKAGFKAGDIMVEFDGKPIQKLNDFTYLLRAKKPGDVVVVVVKRNGQNVRRERDAGNEEIGL